MIQLNLFGWSEDKPISGKRKPSLSGEIIIDHYTRTVYIKNELLDTQIEHIFPYPLFDTVDYEIAMIELERRRIHRVTMDRNYQIKDYWLT